MITKFGLKTGLIFWGIVAVLLAVFGGGGSHDPHAINIWEIAQKAFNILILLDILFFASGNYLKEFFTGREEQIKSDLKTAREDRAKFEKDLKEIQDRMSSLDSEIDEILNNARKQGEAEKDEIISKAKSEAEKIIAMTKEEIEVEYQQAQKKLQAKIADLAIEKSREIVQAQIKPKDQEKLVKEYISWLKGIE